MSRILHVPEGESLPLFFASYHVELRARRERFAEEEAAVQKQETARAASSQLRAMASSKRRRRAAGPGVAGVAASSASGLHWENMFLPGTPGVAEARAEGGSAAAEVAAPEAPQPPSAPVTPPPQPQATTQSQQAKGAPEEVFGSEPRKRAREESEVFGSEPPSAPAAQANGAAAFTSPSGEARPEAGSGPAAAAAALRRRLRHPLERFPEELVLWAYDENLGSPAPAARASLKLPQDTMARALWRAMLAMESAVNGLSVRSKRRVYLLMRQLTTGECGGEDPATGERLVYSVERAAAAADDFLPEVGMTLGQLAVFHILLTRTTHQRAGDLAESVRVVYEAYPDTYAPPPLQIDADLGPRLVFDASTQTLSVQGAA